MTEVKEVEQNCEDRPESIDNGTVAMKESEMGEEKPREDKIEAEGVEETQVKSKDDDGEDEQTEESGNEEDAEEKKSQSQVVDGSDDGRKELHVDGSREKSSDENIEIPVDAAENGRDLQTDNGLSMDIDEDHDAPVETTENELVSTQKSPVNDEQGPAGQDTEEENGVKLDVCDSLNDKIVDETISRTYTGSSPDTQSPPSKAELAKHDVKDEDKLICPTDVESRNTSNVFVFDTDTSGGGDSGTEKEQVAFIMELHKFHKERGLDFKPPKFYGVPLNLLKLWRAVLKLGGYDTVTSCKYWRQVGESFKPPRTCTTISFTFRIFYEKALLEYERYRRSAEGSGLPASLSVPMVAMDAENQALGSGRARRDAASRAMQGWHSHRILDNGEVSDPITKDKSSVSLNKKEKPLKSLDGILKRNIPSSTDDVVTPVHKLPKIHSDATVIDIGSPADWVKINVRATRDCYEVYALVPGLLREEVRVQSDPAGRLVISGEPENPDNPWNVTPFKKVVSLPSRIDPHQTSAVVTLHGQLFVRVPFEHYD